MSLSLLRVLMNRLLDDFEQLIFRLLIYWLMNLNFSAGYVHFGDFSSIHRQSI